jgi:TM2 domain-containing membrane protein YozV
MRIPVRVGYNTKNQHCGTIENVLCPKCGKITPFLKMKNTTTGKVMFIPVAKITNSAFVVCSSCQSAFEVSKKEFSHINSNLDVIHAIYNFHRSKIERDQKTSDKYSVGFSSKNQTVAVILSFLLTSFGAPFFYIGKPLFGVLCLLVSIASRVFGFFPAMSALVYGGFVYAILLGLGKIKDGKGKYIASKKQQLLFTQSIKND